MFYSQRNNSNHISFFNFFFFLYDRSSIVHEPLLISWFHHDSLLGFHVWYFYLLKQIENSNFSFYLISVFCILLVNFLVICLFLCFCLLLFHIKRSINNILLVSFLFSYSFLFARINSRYYHRYFNYILIVSKHWFTLHLLDW